MFRAGGGYQVLYLLASASFTVFALAGGPCCCAQGAAVTQPCIAGVGTPNDGAEASITATKAPCCITGAGTPNSGAEAPITDAEAPNSGDETPITDVEAPCCITGAGTPNDGAKASITGARTPN